MSRTRDTATEALAAFEPNERYVETTNSDDDLGAASTAHREELKANRGK